MAGSHVLHRNLLQGYPVAISANGCEITDSSGRVYLDGSSGAAVSCLGHRHPAVLDAMHAQLAKLEFAHTSFFTTPVAEELADDLIGHAPAGFGLCQFVSGGSEAVEAALKIARQYFVEIGQPDRHLFIARRQSYHGSTLGALAMTGRRGAREAFEPLLATTGRVAPCHAYRDALSGESAHAYGARLAAELEQEIVRLGPGNVAAFIAETVVGATLGAVPPVEDYFRKVKAVCDRHGVLLILDEVMAGMGRTGTLYAFEREGVRPDLVTIAKGLGAGYVPIGAVLVSAPIAEAFVRGSGALKHGHTYIGHPLACAAALAVQQVIRQDGLLGNIERQGALLRQRLEERLGDHPHVGDIRGRGLLQAIEFVADRETRQPFPAAAKLHALVRWHALDLGLMVFGMGGTVDGLRGDHAMLAPPYIVDEAIVEDIVTRLATAIDRATAGIAGLAKAS